jgi:hypothetical protein
MIDIYTIGKKGVFGLAICTSSEEGPPPALFAHCSHNNRRE